ncbi:MAG TPA: alpha/beta fold hydrolase [Actinomycetota bacterium]
MEPLRCVTADGVSLDAELRRPEGEPRGTAVICHPHPLHGGSKDHPLLWNIRNDLAGRGFVVLGFNFRGVMGSEGEHGGGVDEIEDVRAAIGRVREEAPGPTVVAGWSFGANVALREAVDDERAAALALIGFPVNDPLGLPPPPGRDELAAFDRPVLFVSGEADQFSPVPDLNRLARRLPRGEVVILPNTDHFFWKREKEVATLIGEFVERSVHS